MIAKNIGGIIWGCKTVESHNIWFNKERRWGAMFTPFLPHFS
jgi:hypothetical protein